MRKPRYLLREGGIPAKASSLRAAAISLPFTASSITMSDANKSKRSCCVSHQSMVTFYQAAANKSLEGLAVRYDRSMSRYRQFSYPLKSAFRFKIILHSPNVTVEQQRGLKPRPHQKPKISTKSKMFQAPRLPAVCSTVC